MRVCTPILACLDRCTAAWLFQLFYPSLSVLVSDFQFCIVWESNFWDPWSILLSKIYHLLGLSGTLSYAVFVYLCICIYVFAHLTHGSIIFDTLEQSSFQKYTTCWVFLALCHMPYLCICVIGFLYLRVWHVWISFLIPLNNPLFKNIPHVGSIWHFVICCICVFVYLCICIFVFVRLTHVNIIFDTSEQFSFQKYTTCWVFLALHHMLYLCIIMWHFNGNISFDILGPSVWRYPKCSTIPILILLFSNKLFQWSEDRATQLLICESLSLAILYSYITKH